MYYYWLYYKKKLIACQQREEVVELSKMFRPGQYVAVKILEVKNSNLMLSMMPQHVNSGRSQSELHRGESDFFVITC